MSTGLELKLQTIFNEKEEKIIPENIKKGVQIFNIEGTYEGSGGTTVEGAKIFANVEEMQADTTAQEGDLAVVYRSETQNATVDSRFQVATFPDTVILDTAITDYVEVRYSAVDDSVMFDCMGQLDSSMFMMNCYTESDSIRIQYTSEDGITYTRTDTTGNPVDFGTEIYYEYTEMWNDAIGYFIQTSGMTFEGLYEYGLVIDSNYVILPERANATYNTTTQLFDVLLTKTETKINKAQMTELIKTILTDEGVSLSAGMNVFKKDNKIYVGYVSYLNSSKTLAYDTACAMAIDENYQILDYVVGNVWHPNTTSTSEHKFTYFEVDLENNTYIKAGEVSGILQPCSNSYRAHFNIPGITTVPVRFMVLYNHIYYGWYVRIATSGTLEINLTLSDPGTIDYAYDGYKLVPTQLSATADYVYEKEFYGANGIEIGVLGVSPNNTFADVNAKIVYNIQQQYENMEPRVLTDDDKTIDKNIYFIPVKKDGTVLLDTSSVTSMYYMFQYCANLTEIPLLNTDKVTDMQRMFIGCTNLTTISLLNTSSVTNMIAMFQYCTNLTKIPLLNTSSVITTNGMFYECTNLPTIPLLDTSSVTNMGNMFYKCTNLTTIPLLDTSSVTDMRGMFQYCTNLTEIPLLNTSSVTNMGNMFSKCISLSDASLNNILAMCTNATSYTSTKTLSYIGLSEEQVIRCQSLSNWAALSAAGWTA